MAGKLMGLQKAQRHLEAKFGEIQSQKIVTAITAASIIISTEAASMTPIDTSTLINGQFRTISYKADKVTGRIGYSAHYAAALNKAPGTLKGQPRAHFGKTSNHSEFGPKQQVEFGGGSGSGVYWGPQGEPHFFDKAIANTKEMVDAAIKREMKI